MDFFDRQDHARRQTRRLVVMFILAVAVIILAIYLVLVLAMGAAAPTLDTLGMRPGVRHYQPDPWYPQPYPWHPPSEVRDLPPGLWQPQLFLWVSLGTIVVITVASLYKISELSAGGETVALMLGGRPVNPQTTDLAERRLLNVVEEMALASGIPVPPVFILDREPGINAFAAGHQPGNAVVAVSRGCLDYLTREELQGVMGHEFSHILNGDMRLNLRLIGIVFGILVLAVTGYYIMRSASVFSSRDSKGSSVQLAAFLLGLTLLVLGYLGVFLGKLIKSAVSRQREFLADASSVQFTRYPGGIAGALKKIGGLAEGSRIRDAHAEEISHMFFGDAFAGSLLNLLATHPPLVKRILALEPDFDGRFPKVQAALTADEADTPRRVPPLPFPVVMPAAAAAVMGLDAGQAVGRIGQPQTEHLDHAGRTIGDLPAALTAAAREPLSAQAVVCALLLNREDEATRDRQLQLLQETVPPALFQEVQRLAGLVQSLPAASRLPLVNLAVPALQKASPPQYVQFRRVVESLVAAEHRIGLFDYCLRIVLFSYLDVYFRVKRPPAIRYRTVASVRQPLGVVLSTLAYAGQSDREAAERVFQAEVDKLLADGAEKPAELLPQEQCTLAAFDAALGLLAQGDGALKRRVIAAAAACIATDGKVTLAEDELFRAVAAALACPAPPRAGGPPA
jgi:Zn-dependent protease with chaperone function